MDYSYLDSDGDTGDTDGYDTTETAFDRTTGSELKFFDTTRAQTVVAATGTIMNNSLNLIVQGTDENERIGRKCTIVSLGMRGSFVLPATTAVANTSDRVRVIVYVDQQTNGVTAAVTDILAAATIDNFYDLPNSGRFVILADYQTIINSKGGVGDGTTNLFVKTTEPFVLSVRLNLPIEFSGTGGFLTEIQSNNIGILAITESGFAAFGYTARVRYSDE